MFSDDTALVGLINQGNYVDYRREIELFVTWCDENVLKLNLEKTKELIVDFRRNKEVTIKGQQVEIVQSYKYLGAHLDSKLNRKRNSDAVFKKTQSRLFFLTKHQKLLYVFYQEIIASVLFYAVLFWGSSITVNDKHRINTLIRKAGSVIGLDLDAFEVIVEKRTKVLTKVLYFTFSHLADAFIQSDLQIRKSN